MPAGFAGPPEFAQRPVVEIEHLAGPLRTTQPAIGVAVGEPGANQRQVAAFESSQLEVRHRYSDSSSSRGRPADAAGSEPSGPVETHRDRAVLEKRRPQLRP